jgi:hypothetical protein
VDNSLTGVGRDVRADDTVLLEFRKVAGAVPNMDVGAGIEEGFRRMTNDSTKLFEFKDTVVNIVAIIERDVTINRFRTPYFGWNFDDKSRSGGQGRRQNSRSGREGQSRGEGERRGTRS